MSHLRDDDGPSDGSLSGVMAAAQAYKRASEALAARIRQTGGFADDTAHLPPPQKKGYEPL